MALDAIRAALNEMPRADHRHRLEHVVFPSQRNLERIRELGVIVSTQPQWIRFWGEAWRRGLGEEVAQRAMPLKTMLRMGIPVAFGCDVPATWTHEPKWAFLASITRRTGRGYTLGPDERISMPDALRCHTMGSAYANFEEDVKGSIEEGKLADMIVWSKDPYSIPADEMKDLEAEITILDGKIVHKAEDSAPS